jgi:hypothetical protein
MTVSKVTIYNPHITQMISWLNECEYIHNIMQSPYYQNNLTAYLSVSIYVICNPHDAQMISWPTCTSVRIYTTRINIGFIMLYGHGHTVIDGYGHLVIDELFDCASFKSNPLQNC